MYTALSRWAIALRAALDINLRAFADLSGPGFAIGSNNVYAIEAATRAAHIPTLSTMQANLHD